MGGGGPKNYPNKSKMSELSYEEQWLDALDYLRFGYKNMSPGQSYRYFLELAISLQDFVAEAKMVVSIVCAQHKKINAYRCLKQEAVRVDNNGFLWYITVLFELIFIGICDKSKLDKAASFEYMPAVLLKTINGYGNSISDKVYAETLLKCCRLNIRSALFFYGLLQRDLGNTSEYARCVLKAAKLGYVYALEQVISDPGLFDNEVNRWKWMTKLVCKGSINLFCNDYHLCFLFYA